MVTQAHTAHQEKRRGLHRAVFKDWGLYGFARILDYMCRQAGKARHRLAERYTSQE